MNGIAPALIVMAGSGTHVILRAILDFDLPGVKDAAAIQEKLSRVFWKHLAGEAERILTDAGVNESVTRIHRLELHVGTLDGDQLETQLIERFGVALREALHDELARLRAASPPPAVAQKPADRRLELLAHFLAHGSIPWWWTEDLRDGTEPLLAALAAEAPSALRGMLVDLGRRHAVRRRIVLQYSTASLHALVKVLEPGDAEFIIGYAESLQKDQEREAIVAAGSREFHDAKWELILEHLLVDRGSEFNRKEFLESNIAGMANRFRVSYEHLLQHLAAAASFWPQHGAIPSLARMILELWRESVAGGALPTEEPLTAAGQSKESDSAEAGAIQATAAATPLQQLLLHLMPPHGALPSALGSASFPWVEALRELRRLPRRSREALWREAVRQNGARVLSRRLTKQLPESSLPRFLQAVGSVAMAREARRLASGPPFARPLPGAAATAPGIWVWLAAFEVLAEQAEAAIPPMKEWLALVSERLNARLRRVGLAMDIPHDQLRGLTDQRPQVLMRGVLAPIADGSSPGVDPINRRLDFSRLRTEPEQAFAVLEHFLIQGKIVPASALSALPGGPDALLLRLLLVQRRRTVAFVRGLGGRRGGWELFARRFRDDTLASVTGALRPESARILVPLTRFFLRQDVGRQLAAGGTTGRRRHAWQAALRTAAQPTTTQPSRDATVLACLTQLGLPDGGEMAATRIARAAMLDHSQLGREVFGLLAGWLRSNRLDWTADRSDQPESPHPPSELQTLECLLAGSEDLRAALPPHRDPDLQLRAMLLAQPGPTRVLLRRLASNPRTRARIVNVLSDASLEMVATALEPGWTAGFDPIPRGMVEATTRLAGGRAAPRDVRRFLWGAALALMSAPTRPRDVNAWVQTLAARVSARWAIDPSLLTRGFEGNAGSGQIRERPAVEPSFIQWLKRGPQETMAGLRALRRDPAAGARVIARANDAELLKLLRIRLPQWGHLMVDYASACLDAPARTSFGREFRRRFWETILEILALSSAPLWTPARLLESHLAIFARRLGMDRSTLREMVLVKIHERGGNQLRRIVSALKPHPAGASRREPLRHSPPMQQDRRRHRTAVIHHDLAARLRLFEQWLQQPARVDRSLLAPLWEAALVDSEVLYRELLRATRLRPKSVLLALSSDGFDALLRIITGADHRWRSDFSEWTQWLERIDGGGDWLPFPPRQLRLRLLLSMESAIRRSRTVPDAVPRVVLELLLDLGVWRRVLQRWPSLATKLPLPSATLLSLPNAPAPVGLANFLLTILAQSQQPPPPRGMESIKALAALLAVSPTGIAGPSASQPAAVEPGRKGPVRDIPRREKEIPSRARELARVETGEPIFVTNAGLALVAPFFPTYFEICGLLAGDKFKDAAAADRAVHLVQQLVTFDNHAFEHTLTLNKILCGLDVDEPVSAQLEFTPEERQAATDLLTNAIRHWGRVTLSLAGFQNSFLWRPGKLERTDDAWKLVVERRTYDLLLTSVPWSFSVIKASYMPVPLFVNWI